MNDRQRTLEENGLLRDPDVSTVMECVFGVREHEQRAYEELLARPGITVEELASVLDRDRSSVHRALSTLVEKGLIERERRLLEGGGYVYQYYPVALPEAREAMHAAVEEWTERVHQRIDEFSVD